MCEYKRVQKDGDCARVVCFTRVGVMAVDGWLVSVTTVSCYLLGWQRLGGLAPSSVGSV